MQHSLKSKFGDLILESKLWFWTWAALTSSGMAAAIFFLRKASGNPDMWGYYMLAKPLDFFGLENLPIIPPGWFSPGLVIEYTQEKIPPALLDKWDADFLLLALYTPIASTLLIVILVFVFIDDRLRKSAQPR